MTHYEQNKYSIVTLNNVTYYIVFIYTVLTFCVLDQYHAVVFPVLERKFSLWVVRFKDANVTQFIGRS